MVNDSSDSLTGKLAGTGASVNDRKILWTNAAQPDPSVAGAVCQIVVGGTVLQQYTKLSEGIDASNSIGGGATVYLEILSNKVMVDWNNKRNFGKADHTIVVRTFRSEDDNSGRSGRSTVIANSTHQWFDFAGTVEFTDIILDGYKEKYYGAEGQIGDVGGQLILSQDCTIQNCKSNGNGGAFCIDAIGAKLTMKDNAEIIDSTSPGSGGAIHIHPEGKLEITDNAVIRGCSAGNGGAVYSQSTQKQALVISGSAKFQNNSAATSGGAIYVSSASTTIDILNNAEFSGNEAKTGYGGAIYATGNNDVINIADNGKVTNNTSKNEGAAIYASGANSKLTLGGNADVTRNKTQGTVGCAIYLTNTNAQTEVSGAPTVRGNYKVNSSGDNISERNVYLVGNNLTVTGDLNGGDVGIYSNANYETGDQFGITTTSSSLDTVGLNNLTNDRTTEAISGATTRLVGVPGDGNKVFWYYVCQIVKDGQVKKVYGALEDACADVNSFGNSDLSIEMLISAYQDYKAATINKEDGATVTLTSRTTGDYEYKDFERGSNGKATVYRGYDGNSMLTVSKGNLTVKNITADGHNKNIDGTDSNIFTSTQKGGIVLLNDNASALVLDSNSVLRNSTSADAGGAVWLKGGSTFIMKENAEIHDCQSKKGGAICGETGATKYTFQDSSRLHHNSSSDIGGALSVGAGGIVVLEQKTITDVDTTKGENVHWFANIAEKNGGAIYIDSKDDNTTTSTLTSTDKVLMQQNTATTGNGGAIYASKNATISLVGTTIQNNIAGNNGGGLYGSQGVKYTIDNGTSITNNRATNDGGGIYLSSGESNPATLDIKAQNSIHNNSAGQDGGGIFVNQYASVTMENNTIIQANEATRNGGGVYIGSNGSLSSSKGNSITDNKAGQNGGGLYLAGNGSIHSQENLKITSNTAIASGGGIYMAENAKSDTDGINIEISDNEAKTSGAGIYVGSNAELMLNNASNVKTNGKGQTTYTDGSKSTAVYGGGIYIAKDGKVTLQKGDHGVPNIESNLASTAGGAVYVASGGTLTLKDNPTFSNHEIRESVDTAKGAGIYLASGSKLNIQGSPRFNNNQVRDTNYKEKKIGGQAANAEVAPQDIYLDDANDVASEIVVTGDLTGSDGSIKIWAESDKHRKKSQQFATLKSDASFTSANNLKVFNNYRDDSVTDNDTGAVLYGTTGANANDIYWNSSGVVINAYLYSESGDTVTKGAKIANEYLWNNSNTNKETWTVADNKSTYARMQNISSDEFELAYVMVGENKIDAIIHDGGKWYYLPQGKTVDADRVEISSGAEISVLYKKLIPVKYWNIGTDTALTDVDPNKVAVTLDNAQASSFSLSAASGRDIKTYSFGDGSAPSETGKDDIWFKLAVGADANNNGYADADEISVKFAENSSGLDSGTTAKNLYVIYQALPAPTGVSLRFLPWLLIALAGGAIVLTVRRRRSE